MVGLLAPLKVTEMKALGCKVRRLQSTKNLPCVETADRSSVRLVTIVGGR